MWTLLSEILLEEDQAPPQSSDGVDMSHLVSRFIVKMPLCQSTGHEQKIALHTKSSTQTGAPNLNHLSNQANVVLKYGWSSFSCLI